MIQNLQIITPGHPSHENKFVRVPAACYIRPLPSFIRMVTVSAHTPVQAVRNTINNKALFTLSVLIAILHFPASFSIPGKKDGEHPPTRYFLFCTEVCCQGYKLDTSIQYYITKTNCFQIGAAVFYRRLKKNDKGSAIL